MTQKLKSIMVAVIALSIFLSISCVCASDIENATTDTSTFDNTTQLNEYQPVPGSFEDLNHDIQNLHPGDTYNIDRDYYFNDVNILFTDRVITIYMNNIVINGNGHIIDAGGLNHFAIFRVSGDNVKISNLTFINSQPYEPPTIIPINDQLNKTYVDTPNPISWYGNNGIISDCTFKNTEATLGGAISWRGSNGIINNCTFINSTAKTVGGAIYIGGEHNVLNDNLFVDCRSILTNEAIFTDYSRKDFTVLNTKFDSCGKIIVDGSAYAGNIVKYLGMEVNSYVADKKINLVNILYSAIINIDSIYCGMIGNKTYLDDEISYCIQYTVCHSFILTVYRDFNEYGITYKKDYIFDDINGNINQVFDLLEDGNFKNDITIIVNKTVKNEQDYNAAWKTTASDSLRIISDKLTSDLEGYLPLKNNKITTALNVIFTKKISFKNTNTWSFTGRDFDIINIDGNYSTIEGLYSVRDDEKWVILYGEGIFSASNLYIKGFNTAVENMGAKCIFTNVTFSNNKMDYIIDRDWGAAILNLGEIYCYNCSFIDNEAKNGGAIFNQGRLVLNDCHFRGNYAYCEGDHICVGKGGTVIINGMESTVENNHGPVHFAESLDEETCNQITDSCFLVSFLGGMVVGALTANPAAGALVGAALGALIGSMGASYIVSREYDVNYNKVQTCLVLILGSAMFGAFGGAMGGALTAKPSSTESINIIEDINKKSVLETIEEVTEESVEDSIGHSGLPTLNIYIS